MSGAAAVAAVLAGKVGATDGQHVVCTVSGEKRVWPAMRAGCIRGFALADGRRRGAAGRNIDIDELAGVMSPGPMSHL